MQIKQYFLINDLSAGGAERVIYNVANSSDDSIVVTLWPSNFYGLPQSKIKTLLKRKRFLPLDILLASCKLYLYVKRNNIRVMNSHLFWANYVNYIVSLLTKHRTIFTHCVSLTSKFKGNIHKLRFHKFLMKFLFQGKRIHTYKSLAMKIEYENIFGANDGVVIYNPLDYSDIKSKSLSRVNFDFKKENVYLISVGRFHITKGQEFLISNLLKLPENFHLILLGSGERLKDSKKLAISTKLSHRVHFIGQVANPYPYFLNSDVYVSNSSAEGLPNALLEAICLNLKVVHSDCFTGPREVLSNFSDFIPKANYIGTNYDKLCFGYVFETNNSIGYLNAVNSAVKELSSPDDVFEFDFFLHDLRLKSITNHYSELFKRSN